MDLNKRPEHLGRIGLLRISLGAENAAIAVSEDLPIDAVVLVDGVPPSAVTFLSQKMPPFRLIWCSQDAVYSVASGQRFIKTVKKAGGVAAMAVFHGGAHDFFLRSKTEQANEAYDNAIQFLRSELSKN